MIKITIPCILLQLQQERQDKNIIPIGVLYQNLKSECIKQGYLEQELKDQLNEMYNENKIKVNRTINSKSIELL